MGIVSCTRCDRDFDLNEPRIVDERILCLTCCPEQGVARDYCQACARMMWTQAEIDAHEAGAHAYSSGREERMVEIERDLDAEVLESKSEKTP